MASIDGTDRPDETDGAERAARRAACPARAADDSEARTAGAAEGAAREILEAAPAPIAVVEAAEGDLLVSYCNRAFEALAGRARGEIVGRALGALLVRSGAEDGDLSALLEARSGELTATVRRTLRRPDGHPCPVEIRASPAGVGSDGRSRVVVFREMPAEAAPPMRDAADERRVIEQALRESELRYRRLVEQASDAIVIARRGGRYVDANSSACRLTGYTREELLTMRPEDIITEESLRVRPPMWDRYEEGQTYRFERVMRRKDGTTFPAEISAGVLQGDYILGIIRDVTERERAEQEQKAMKAFYENVLNELPLQLAVLDYDARYVYVNPAAVSRPETRAWIIGKTPADYGRHFNSDPAVFEERYQWLLRVARGETTEPFEESFITRSGERRYFLRMATRIKGPAGETQVIAFGLDVTERKDYEGHIIEAKEKAEEMNRLKSSFLANISHEVRTPLTAIIGSSALLAQEVNEEQRELAQLIERGGHRLLATLNSVLELSILEAGSVRLNREELDLEELVEEVVGLHRAAAVRKDVELRVELASDERTAEVDDACLARILNNLIGNAVKFTEAGAVTVTLGGTPDEVEIQVRDTGVGIDEAFQPHLFEAFKQESMGIKRIFEGTGLGLYISRKLTDLLGGEISVESRKGEGSLFKVRFPRRAAVRV